LGSITQISNNSGNLAAEYSYDAWGRMRNVNNWQVYAQGTQPTMPFGMRGYTGHEQLNGFGIINMNARLYDPLLGRFLAADPQVASPETSNGYNRYMYASDNPLMYVDIDGERRRHPTDCYPGINISGGNNSGNQGGNNNGNQGGNNNTWQWNPPFPVSNKPAERLYNPYSGPNPGYQGGYSGYNGGSGSSSGGIPDGSLSSVPALILYGINLIINSKPDPRFAPQASNATYTAPVILNASQNVSQKPINLPKPVGTGASTVYAGGGSRRSGNTQSGWGGGFVIDKGIELAGKTNDLIDAGGKVSMVSAGKAIGRITGPAGFAIGAAQIGRGYYKDGNRFGYHAQKATAGFAGGLAGAYAGFEVGATVGFEGGFLVGAAVGGIGAIPGAVIGGILGGFGGAFGGAYYGGQFGESLITNKVR